MKSLRPPRFLRRLIARFTWGARDRDMDQEMAFHLELITRDYVRAGMSEAEAAREARRRFGSPLRLKEQGHDIVSARFVEGVVRDIKHAGRGLRRSLGFAVAVVLTLAFGIGGNTAIFSAVDQLLLRPLPYPNGHQLLTIYESSSGTDRFDVSPANWLDWQRESRTLQGLAAWRTFAVTLTGVGEPARLKAQLVSFEFFPLLGVKPLLGRTLSEEDDRPNAPPVVVLSHQLWERRFGSDPSVIGHIVQSEDTPTEIVGVMPVGFGFVYPDNDVWGAFKLPRNLPWRETSGRFLNVVARLKPGTTLAGANADMRALAGRLAATYSFNKNTTVVLVPLREELTGHVRTWLLVLYAAVGVLLLITCFNVANLLLARAASRSREIAIRSSLGAGRLAIAQQFLVESLLLAALGGALGIALAYWTLDVLLAFAPADLLRVPELFVDRRALLYAVGVSGLTGLVVGLVPAVSVARHSMALSLRSGGFTMTQSPHVRQMLVIGQVAMTLVLLCGAGLLVRTLHALTMTRNGLDRHNVLTMDIQLSRRRYTPERTTAFFRDTVAALRSLPGVESAAAGNSLPVIGARQAGTSFHRLGTPEVPMSERPSVVVRVVTPGYFRTLRIPVLRGREFTDSDDASPRPGFVVNDAFAKAFLSDIDPLRASLSVNMDRENPYVPVIGVVGDVSEGSVRGNISEGSVRDSAKPTVFYSHRQMPMIEMTLFIRTGRATAIAMSAVSAIHTLDANVAVTKLRTFDDAIAESLARERLGALVSSAFALTGLLLAALGLYGLLAFLVTERTREIGMRIALGAQLGQVIRLVVGGGLRLVGIGAAIGIGGSLVMFRFVRALLFGVTPYDWPTYASVLGLVCGVTTLASYLPARRAARVEPLVALRQE